MNGKPKSYRAMLLAVAAACHSEIDGTDKALLNVLAVNADGETGNNSRPGNASLLAGTCLRWSALHVRIEKNIARGLIECTYRANAKGKASVYRVCLENTSYPDRAPNGEWLIASPEPAPTVRPEPDSSPLEPSGLSRTVAPETVRPNPANRPVEGVQPSGGSGQPSGLDRTTSKYTSKNTPNNTPTTPDEPSGVVVRACEEKNHFNHVMENVPTDMVASQWKKSELEEFKKLASEHGWEKVVAATTLYWREQDPDSFNRTLFKWSAFIAAFPAWLKKVTPEMLKQMAWERWRSTTEGAAEYERQIQASIAADIKQHNRPPQPLTPEQAEEKRKRDICDAAIERALAGEQVQAPDEMKLEDFDFFPEIEGKDFKTGCKYRITVDEATKILVAEYE